MENHEYDTVKAEKENAIAKYKRVRNIAKLFKLLEVLFALTLISWSSTWLPSAVKLSREYIIEFSAYLLNPHVVFVIGNVIVGALYMLSRHFDVAENDSTSDNADIVSEEDQKCNTIDHNAATASAATYDHELVEEESSAEDKKIVCYENAIKTECEVAEVVIEEATREIQRFKRTQSEKLKRELSMKPRKEFRRWRTEIRRQVDTSPNHGRRTLASFDKVDRLSNEEFRLTVEAFIEKQQSFLKSQKLAEFFK